MCIISNKYTHSRSGWQVILFQREHGSLIPVEIKSAETFSTDFLKCLDRFQSLGLKRVAAGSVLYNGTQEFTV